MKYKVALKHTDEGVSASVPGLPGCCSQDINENQALENIKEAVLEYLTVVDDQLAGTDIREVEVTAL